MKRENHVDEQPGQERVKVLLIEDNPGDMRLIRELLSDFQQSDRENPLVDIVWADNLNKGMEHLASENIDVLLLDLSLPDSRGFETFLKVTDRAPNIPIIILTGLDDETMAVKALQGGAQDYLIKGHVDSGMLGRAVIYAMERKRIQTREEKNPVRILLVEDHEGDAKLISISLTETPSFIFDLTHVKDLNEAFNALDKRSFDIILLDLLLPDSHGIETFMRIRERAQEIPIIVITVLGDERHAIQALRKGAQDYIVKGQIIDDLLIRRIQYAIERHRLERERQIRNAEETYRLLTTYSQSGIYIIQDRKMQFVNPYIMQHFGFSAEELTSMSILNMVHPGDREIVRINAVRMLRGESTIPYEYRITDKGGQIRWLIESVSSIPFRGKRATLGNVMDITDRKLAEQQLKKRMKELQAVYHLGEIAGREGVTLDRLCREFTDILPQSLQYPEIACARIVIGDSEFHTKNFAESTWMQSVSVKVSGSIVGKIEVGYLEGRPEEGEGPFLKEEKVLIDSIAERLGHIIDRKRAEEQIREYSENLERMVEERTGELNRALFDSQEARDRIDGILKSVADGLIVTDLHNRVILMNRAAEDLLGVRLSDVINRSIDYAIDDTTLRERIRTTLEKREQGYQFDFELPGDNDAHPRIMRARTSVIEDMEGNHTGIITVIHDVTYEREVDRMKTEFLSTAAHELRFPLTSIQGFSELLMSRDDIKEDERTRFLSHINRQSRNLAGIISDLLDISRIESGKGFALKKVPTDIKEIVKSAVSNFESVSTIHRFDMTFPGKPVEVMIDPDKMEQVLSNIFSNAVKYSPRGGVIRITGTVSGDHYQVSIEDEGMGMTPEQVEKIFDKFYRVDASNTAVVGTGLGMSIVKHIMEAHGGTVLVESEPGKGTTVRFTVPGISD